VEWVAGAARTEDIHHRGGNGLVSEKYDSIRWGRRQQFRTADLKGDAGEKSGADSN
jgi:hypothetical protein